MANIMAPDAIMEAELYGVRDGHDAPRDEVFFKVIALPAAGVEVALKLRAGVPVTVRLADASPSLPAVGGQTGEIGSALRTGFGGGHGIDSMTLIQRQYRVD